MLGRFQARGQGTRRAADYIQYNGLGRATVRTRRLEEVDDILPVAEHGTHPGPVASVVLIDEIDKAPRDFPNDILNEVERFQFRIPELGHKFVEADQDYRPVIVLTSNAEKSLPPAFLRRCVYFHIGFPDPETLRQIVEKRVGRFPGGRLIPDALGLFDELRSDETGLQKKPATAELLGWLIYLRERQVDMMRPLSTCRPVVEESLCVLVKEKDDQPVAQAVLRRWLES
jgi:MoxR-like ATPase